MNIGHGRVQVYAYDESQWNQVGLDIHGESASDNSGWAVSMSYDGTILAIGAYGMKKLGLIVETYGYTPLWRVIGFRWVRTSMVICR